MKKKHKIWLGVVLPLAVVALVGWYLRRHAIPVLQPAGEIGHKERGLMIFGASLSLLVVVPVFTLLGVVAWKYREGNTKQRTYTPDVGGNRLAETVWWLIPTVLIGIISVVTWRSSYALDPFKSLSSSKKPLTVQVVALDWKWLFIYPDQNVASVNEVAIPTGTPVNFEITSDTVMNSFWIPQLGGQMYAMPGMSTQLHLMASKVGDYNGSSANISGKGFASMKFVARAMPAGSFDAWITSVQHSGTKLNDSAYIDLARPGENSAPVMYKDVTQGLYDTIVMKYMMPDVTNLNTNTGPETKTDSNPQYLNLHGTKL